jgi:membrane-associated phospholipid phosphatase
MSERDDFDRIVEGLDLDLSFIDEPLDEPELAPAPAPPQAVDVPDEDEAFYRQVDATPLVPRRRDIVLAWAGVIGAPMALVLATVAHVYLDRPVVAGAALIFVASAIYLFLQLPEHGPSRRDWPDDGAVL